MQFVIYISTDMKRNKKKVFLFFKDQNEHQNSGIILALLLRTSKLHHSSWQAANCIECADKQLNIMWKDDKEHHQQNMNDLISPFFFPSKNLKFFPSKPPELHQHMHIITLCAIELVGNDKLQSEQEDNLSFEAMTLLSHIHKHPACLSLALVTDFMSEQVCL